MRPYFIAIFTIVTIIFSSCFEPQTKPRKKSTQIIATGEEKEAKVTNEANGILTAAVSANSGNTQLVKASEDSNIKDTVILFPPGALSIDTEITIEEGSNLANSDTSSELGIATDNELTSASAPVVITSSADIDASNPFTLSLPVGSGDGLSLADDSLLIIIYKVRKQTEGGKLVVGIIPNSDLTLGNGKVSFETQYFGAYQAVYTKIAITEKVEAESEKEIETKAADLTPPSTVILSDVPEGTNSISELNIKVSGDDVTHYKYVLAQTSATSCRDLTFSTKEYSVDTLIQDDISSLTGRIFLCVIGRDSAGNYMDKSKAVNYSWTRKETGSTDGGDSTDGDMVASLEVTSSTVTNNANNVRSGDNFTFSFNNQLNTTTTDANVTLKSLTESRNLSIGLTYANQQSDMTITPNEPLKINHKYRITINTNIRSTNGAALANALEYEFTVTGAWGTTAKLFGENGGMIQPDTLKAFANKDGKILVLWISGTDLHSNFFNGTTWGGDRLALSGITAFDRFTGGVSPNGNPAVLGSNGADLYHRVGNNDGSWNAQTTIDTTIDTIKHPVIFYDVNNPDYSYLTWFNSMSGSFDAMTATVIYNMASQSSSVNPAAYSVYSGSGFSAINNVPRTTRQSKPSCLGWNYNSSGLGYKMSCDTGNGFESPIFLGFFSQTFPHGFDISSNMQSQAMAAYNAGDNSTLELKTRIYSGSDYPITSLSSSISNLNMSLVGGHTKFFAGWIADTSGSTIASVADFNGSSWNLSDQVTAVDSTGKMRLATNDKDRSIAVFKNSDNKLQYFYYDGTNWSSVQTLSPESINVQNYDVTLDSQNIATIIWTETNPGNNVNAYRINLNTGTGSINDSVKSTITELYNHKPRVIVDPNERVHVIWLEGTSSSVNPHARRYE